MTKRSLSPEMLDHASRFIAPAEYAKVQAKLKEQRRFSRTLLVCFIVLASYTAFSGLRTLTLDVFKQHAPHWLVSSVSSANDSPMLALLAQDKAHYSPRLTAYVLSAYGDGLKGLVPRSMDATWLYLGKEDERWGVWLSDELSGVEASSQVALLDEAMAKLFTQEGIVLPSRSNLMTVWHDLNTQKKDQRRDPDPLLSI
jgi:hypothetical protein